MNAHSHLLSIMTGSSESVPVVDGKLKIGRWQSIMLVELDGPRERSVAISFVGLAQA
jgi:secondary thiamine-phosphate synthase enzyme